jgi:putative copper export protein
MDIFLHFLHLTAAMIWVGGQIFLGLILGPVLRRSMTPKERMPLALAVAKRFQRVSHGALGVLIMTGLWQVRFLFLSSLSSFLDTAYGRIFWAKMVLFVVMLILGVLHDKRWGPALALHADRPDSAEFRSAARRMAFWARLNIGVTLGVVLCAAALRHHSF